MKQRRSTPAPFPSASISAGSAMAEVMKVFDRTQADGLPVLDSDDRLKGYVSRQRLYAAYRKMVADMSQE